MKDAGLACGSGWFSPVHQSLNISQFHLFIFPIAHGRLTRFHKSVLCITITYRIPVVKHVKISGEKKCSTTPFLDLRIKAGYNIGKNYEKTVSHTVARGILMKKNIATLPLIEAFRADDECPFCYLERAAQQHAISFILGSRVIPSTTLFGTSFKKREGFRYCVSPRYILCFAALIVRLSIALVIPT